MINFGKLFGSLSKYVGPAISAVAQVQTEVGSTLTINGDNSKKAIAVSYVLAAAHAGEQINESHVQQAAAAVEFAVSIAKALGLFGKTPTTGMVITVPQGEVLTPLVPKV